MVDLELPYWRRCDWDGDGDVDDDDARVYLSRYLLIRLTDPDKNPLPFARCKIKGDPEGTVFECDEDGVAHIPKSKVTTATIELEWEPEKTDGTEHFFWCAIFNVNISDKNDDACSLRLSNLGFMGATLKEQVDSYQTFFNRTPTGNIENIRNELVEWHDGGDYAGQAKNASSDVSSVAELEPDKYISIRLLDFNLNIIRDANCRFSSRIDDQTVYTTKNGDGIVKLPIFTGMNTIEIEWEPMNAELQENGSRFYMRQNIRLSETEDDQEIITAKILHNLGFEGNNLLDQIASYEQYFNKTIENSADEIYAAVTDRSITPTPSDTAIA